MVSGLLDDVALDLADRLVCGTLKVDDAPASTLASFPVATMQRLMFPGTDSVASGEWLGAVAALKRSGWINDRVVQGRRRWRLTDEKSTELRRLHELGEPQPRPSPRPPPKTGGKRQSKALKGVKAST